MWYSTPKINHYKGQTNIQSSDISLNICEVCSVNINYHNLLMFWQVRKKKQIPHIIGLNYSHVGITACSAVTKYDIAYILVWEGNLLHQRVTKKEKEVLGWGEEKHQLFSHTATKRDKSSQLTNCNSYTCNDVSIPVSQYHIISPLQMTSQFLRKPILSYAMYY
jgi:hypothetical protein